jgi:predicted Zn-dependent protease
VLSEESFLRWALVPITAFEPGRWLLVEISMIQGIYSRVCRLNALLVAAIILGGCVSAAQVEMESDDQFQQMRNTMRISNSLTDRAYVRCVSRMIIQQLDEPYASYDWEIELFDDQAINAFAMPGGKIGVFTGIFKVAKNQDQLAAVLGHEVAHVTEDHSLERANRDSITRGVAIYGSEIFDATTGLETTDVMVMGAEVGILLPYGRGQESEADVVGLKYMAAAGFDPRASIELWTNMAKETPLGPPPFLSTHPSGETRIRDLASELTEVLPLYNEALEQNHRPTCRF